jgi:hypothetical protein
VFRWSRIVPIKCSWLPEPTWVLMILTPIDAGGMGEVYRAKDTKLGCDTPLSRYFFCCGRGSEAGGTIFFIRKYTTILP